jgi:predicted RND superfamily exporter protein
VLAGWLIGCLIAAFGIAKLDVETTTGSVLDRADPAWSFYQDSQTAFGGDEILAIALESETPLDRGTLEKVVEISERLEETPGVRRVDSVSTVPLVRARPDGLVSLDAAFADGVPESRDELLKLGSLLRADRLAPRSLVSDDLRAFSVVLVLERGAEADYDAVLDDIDRFLAGAPAWVSGVPVFRKEANVETRRELSTFIPLTVLVIGLLFALLFRSLRAVLIPLATSGCAVWITLGIMGALGVSVTITTAILPSVLLALGCAYSMHLLVAGSSRGGAEARAEAILEVSPLVALSGLTTAIGFVAMALVEIEAIRGIGTFGALGVLIVLAATLTAAPAAMQLWPLPARSPVSYESLRSRAVSSIVSFVDHRRSLVVGGSALVVAVVGVGITKVDVESDVIVWFSRDHPIRIAYGEIRDRFSGISPVNLVVEAPAGRLVTEPLVVERLAELTAFLEVAPEVGKAISMADPIGQMHEGFMGEPGAPLPARQDLIEQYLLVLESKPQIQDLVTSDRTRANVLLRANDNASTALLEVAARAEEWWSSNGVAGYSARATGIMYEFARAEDEIARGQIRGLGFALMAVAVILFAVLGSVRLAVISLIPNALPVAVAFGLMGYLGIALDAGTILVGNLALGIAVDDTLHVASRYHARTDAGDHPLEALRWALERVLSPIAYTTLVVALGFAVLGLSGLLFTRNLGLLTAAVLVLCLLADVILLPALLLLAGERRGGRAPQTRR